MWWYADWSSENTHVFLRSIFCPLVQNQNENCCAPVAWGEVDRLVLENFRFLYWKKMRSLQGEDGVRNWLQLIFGFLLEKGIELCLCSPKTESRQTGQQLVYWNNTLPMLDCEGLGKETNTSSIIARVQVHKFFAF